MDTTPTSVRSRAFHCYACDVPLTQTVREGVEIDYCPHCRSIWLDGGELEKVVNRLVRGELEKVVDRLGAWYPETENDYETPWWYEGDDRIGPRSRLDDPLDVRRLPPSIGSLERRFR